MSTSISPLKAIEGLTFPPNISNETMHEFLTIWMNMELMRNGTKNTKTPNETTDNCLNYCEHNIRDFITQYRNYHGYITLVVSIKYQGYVYNKKIACAQYAGYFNFLINICRSELNLRKFANVYFHV